MFPVMVLAALLAAQANPPPTSTGSASTVVVTGRKSVAPDGKVKVDATVHIDDEDIGEQYGPIWPTKAYDYGEDGHVVLACKINARGFAQSCDVASETPMNMGFGEAALQLQPSLRVPPPASVPPSGSVVMNIAIRFDAPVNSLDGAGASFAAAVGASQGRGISPHTGNPIIMQSVTMMEHPIWIEAPSFEDVRRAYPARGQGIEGFVALRCNVLRTGRLARCEASKEQPEKHGFNQAALSLVPRFRIAPEVMAKAPDNINPIQVVVPIRFAPAEQGAEPTVLSPFWLSGFDQAAGLKVYPAEAAAKGITTGRGMARCVVGADGGLTGCSPEKGDPDGVGFSEAAVVLAGTMKMNLWSADAGPVTGGVVHVPIRLNLAPTR